MADNDVDDDDDDDNEAGVEREVVDISDRDSYGNGDKEKKDKIE